MTLGHFTNGTPISLSDEERRRHVFPAGKTGTGKSTVLRAMLLADIAADRGFVALFLGTDVSRPCL